MTDNSAVAQSLHWNFLTFSDLLGNQLVIHRVEPTTIWVSGWLVLITRVHRSPNGGQLVYKRQRSVKLIAITLRHNDKVLQIILIYKLKLRFLAHCNQSESLCTELICAVSCDIRGTDPVMLTLLLKTRDYMKYPDVLFLYICEGSQSSRSL